MYGIYVSIYRRHPPQPPRCLRVRERRERILRRRVERRFIYIKACYFFITSLDYS
jgi:hypothetical protein